MFDILDSLFIDTPLNEKGTLNDSHKFQKGLSKIILTVFSILMILSIVTCIFSGSVLFQTSALLCAFILYSLMIAYFTYLRSIGVGDGIRIKPLYRVFIQFGILAVFVLIDIEILITGLKHIINGYVYGVSVIPIITIVISLLVAIYNFLWGNKKVLDLSYEMNREYRRFSLLSLMYLGSVSLIYIMLGLLKLPVVDGVLSILLVLYIGYLIYSDIAYRLFPLYTDVVHGDNTTLRRASSDIRSDDYTANTGDLEEFPVRNQRRARPAPAPSAAPAAEEAPAPQKRERTRYVRSRDRQRDAEYDDVAEAPAEQYVQRDYSNMTPKERTIQRLKDLVKEYDPRFESNNYKVEQQGINLFIIFDVLVPEDTPESNIEIKLALNRHIQQTYPLYISDISVVRGAVK